MSLTTHALACVLASFVGATAVLAQSTATPPADLDAYVANVMRTFEVPGLSVAIVKDGKVVLTKGYGVRRLGESAPVDAHTNFGIASNTKLFTATALAILVDEGKVEWDAPVTRYLPAFAMYDPWVTREITVRDLLVHRSGLGLGAGDLLFWPGTTYDRAELVRRLRFIKPATSFRSTYAYDNVLYSVAGTVIEAVSGQSWEDFVTAHVLVPVGMTGSNVRHSDGGRGDNAATPHARVNGAVRPVAALTGDNVNPAGGINSSAADMAKWVMVQLDSGRMANGTRLFTPAATQQLWRLVTPMPIADPPPALAPIRPSFLGYALGLNVRDYRGHKMLTHTGGLPGYVSRVAMLPDLRLGVVVLTNQEARFAYDAIVQHVLDHYLTAPPLDYVGVLARQQASEDAAAATVVHDAGATRDSTSHPSLPLASYAGTYRDAWYGDVQITLEAGRLMIRLAHTPALTGPLEPWQHDTFVARWTDREQRADAFVTFSLRPDGSIEHAKMVAVSPATDFSFDFQDLLLEPVRR